MAILKYSPEQQEAIQRALDAVRNRKPFLISGPAGTGKTEILRAIYQETGGHVAVFTRALAAELCEKIPGSNASTIHRLLGLYKTGVDEFGDWITNEGLEEINTPIIIDEASYVPEWLYRKIIKAGKCGVIFIGDAFQLPPVRSHESAPFLNLTGSNRFDLQEIHRQRGDNGLTRVLELSRYRVNQWLSGASVEPLHEFIRQIRTDKALMGDGRIEFNSLAKVAPALLKRAHDNPGVNDLGFFSYTNKVVDEFHEQLEKVRCKPSKRDELVRTIHRAQGVQRRASVVDVSSIINARVEGDYRQVGLQRERLFYVGISRAQEQICLVS